MRDSICGATWEINGTCSKIITRFERSPKFQTCAEKTF